MSKKKKINLTIKQERFCDKYVECGNASQAYRFAFSCDKMKPESVNRKAVELLSKVKITARVNELKDELRIKSEITKERVLEEYSKIAFSSIAHLHKTWIDLKDFEELTENQKGCIKSISTRVQKREFDGKIIEVEQVKLELYDKLKALDSISKMLGFEAPAKLEVTGKDGKDLVSHNDVDFSTLSEEEMDVLVLVGNKILNETET